MSVLQMAKVWGQKLQGSDGLVLMALADMSDDEGLNCVPHIPYLAWQTNQSERVVRRVLARLEESGFITPLGVEIIDATTRTVYGLHLTASRPSGKDDVNGSRTVEAGMADRTAAEQTSDHASPS